MHNWNFTANGYSYIRLKEGISTNATKSTLQAIVQRNADSESSRKAIMHLQPVSDIHFNLNYENGNPTYTISTTYLHMLILLGAFILLIACVNYINLATSFAFTKSKEIGIRKSIGASQQQLFFYYMFETLIVAVCATIIGLCITIFNVPFINQILDKSITLGPLISLSFIGGALVVILIITFISGAYPAIVLSGFNPMATLTNRLAMPGKTSVIMRKSLVVFQFTISTSLIICTIVIAKQMEYFQNKELGFNKEAVVEVALPERDSIKRESFRSVLQSHASIKSLSFCLGAPISGNGLATSLGAPELPEDLGYDANIITCDKAYKDTYELEMLAGRWFLPSEELNIGTAVVVNRTLTKTLGYTDPEEALGKWIKLGLNDITPIIVGVTEDFHTSSFHNDIGSVALTPFPYFHVAAGIRINPGNLKNTLAEIENAWKQVYPDNVYEIAFIDEALAARYEQESRDYKLFKIFSAISIIICCMGLWGLIAFVVVRKTREIGIRKVLGATISGIVFLISKDFMRLVAIALVLSSSIAGYLMQKWLENFAYPINLSWWIFALAGVFSILLAFVAIGYPAIKAALTDPVKNLRTE
jgi:ABC-type antimicrobial peptide transport system permease subunit